jgi:hypothetical protein
MIKQENNKKKVNKLSSLVATEPHVLKQLLQIKLDRNYRSLNEVILFLLDNYKK